MKKDKLIEKKIFSGDNSRKFWNKINSFGEDPVSKDELQEILYWFGCKCQELESKIDNLEAKLKRENL